MRWYGPSVGICSQNNVTCNEFYVWDIGDPGVILGKWLIATSVILLFAREQMVKRWAYFGGAFFVVSLILVGMTHASLFWGKDAIATLCGIVFVVVTLFWVIADALIARRKVK